MPFQNLSTSQKMLLGGFFIGLCCIGINFVCGLRFPDSDYNFLGKKDQQRLSVDKPITQTFVAQENGLSEVKFNIGNLHLWPGEAIQFELRDQNCQRTIATNSWTPLQSKPLIYMHFRFSPLSDSQDKTYCAYITYSSSYDRKSEDAPHISTNKFPGRSYTAISKNKVYQDETLQMRPAYTSGSFTQDIWRLVERMSQYKPEYIKGLPLLILLSGTFLGSTILGIWIILAKEKE